MKKILIISTFYKPIQCVAANRINAFAKYLHEFGYDVTVLTCGYEYNVGENIEGGIRVIRLINECKGILSPFDTQQKENKFIHYMKCLYNIGIQNISIDSDANWTKIALIKAEHLMKEYDFDYILSSALPIGPHIVGMELKKKYPKVKWIADMRDAISEPRGVSCIYKYQIRKLEKNILNTCDYLLAVSKPQLELFKAHYEGNDIDKFYQIRNGFDFVFEPNRLKNKKAYFSIIYAGSFYGARKPNNFFLALLRVLEKQEINLKVRIIGNKAPIEIPLGLRNIVSEESTLPYEAICKEMKNADALLMVTPSCLEKGIYTGKLFDYLGSGTPIIALAPPDDVAGQLIKQANAGYVAANEDVDAIENIIEKAYDDWATNAFPQPRIEVIKMHHRKEQVRRLLSVLEKDLSK